jgi:hypothetical protein
MRSEGGFSGWTALNLRNGWAILLLLADSCRHRKSQIKLPQLLDVVVDTAIEQRYWGMMITALAAPGEPVWKQNPEWLKRSNQRFLDGNERDPRIFNAPDLLGTGA